MTDAEVAMACNKWLAETKMPGKTIFADVDVLLDQFILLQNPQTKKEVDALPRVEVQFMPVQPQQLALLRGGTARRQFVYVATVVAKSQGYQYGCTSMLRTYWRGASSSAHVFRTPLPCGYGRAPVRTGPGYQDVRQNGGYLLQSTSKRWPRYEGMTQCPT